jgi:hypothetical protein
MLGDQMMHSQGSQTIASPDVSPFFPSKHPLGPKSRSWDHYYYYYYSYYLKMVELPTLPPRIVLVEIIIIIIIIMLRSKEVLL